MNNTQQDVKAAEDAFFSALVTGQTKRLQDVITDDFLLCDVMRGGLIPGKDLIAAMESGALKFNAIVPLSATLTRVHGTTAVVTGETRMNGSFQGQPWEAHSRYTHVYIEDSGRWRLLSAQGTPIPD